MKHTKSKRISYAKQYQNILSEFKDNILPSPTLDNNGFSIRLEVVPTSVSKTYEIEVIYRKSRLSIWLHNIENNGDFHSIPHIYHADKKNKKIKLCLYYPKYKEWDNSMYISRTVIPWAIEWIMHYEFWLFNGKWSGGGLHVQNP